MAERSSVQVTEIKNEFVTCDICMEYYNKGKKSLRQLPCQHSCCCQCLVTLWGIGVTTSWWNRSVFLGTHRITEFKTNENENGIMLVMELFKMKFSLSAVEQMKLYTDTQIREASNRLLSVSLPENVNFSKTMPGRASSTIHRLNNGPSNSTIQKYKHSGFVLSARVKCSLHQKNKETNYQKRYLRRPQVVVFFKYCSTAIRFENIYDTNT